ncbi:ABC transporter, ATP-binding protein [Bifidobacterium lemurum]|uniref:ABC transporter, ATP-binding protein n=2 Tax=Bifidobacterium lemurum TaxID=1603886 RepID=A0A261FST1_9BIFI|nr:ABC transporter, ATP-binding protein [Bifidobacterium lemurum]QOL35448.1 ABC transporter ATP-binding protein [Bifidobacterium lemurum]
MLTLHHVSKRLGGRAILHDIDLELTQGVTGLLAPNGAGKTTLLNMIATLLYPTEGSIQWNGEDIVAMDDRYRGLLGYLPQHFGYYPNYSPRRFLTYIATLQAVRPSRIDVRVDELLRLVGLTDVADKKMRTFSGGMIQRVGIAQALIHDPDLIILDEPTAGLDPKERVRFRNIIHELAADRTVILSTHIVSDLSTIAGRIVMLKNGTVHANSTPEDLISALRGHIYEMPAAMPLPPGQRLLSEVQYGTQTRQRVWSPMPVDDAAVDGRVLTVQPNLEDVFLVTYGE